MSNYVVVEGPDIQYLFNEEGFEENSYLINDEEGIDCFGSSAYFVNADGLKEHDYNI